LPFNIANNPIEAPAFGTGCKTFACASWDLPVATTPLLLLLLVL
jgi:hypothetical protein